MFSFFITVFSSAEDSWAVPCPWWCLHGIQRRIEPPSIAMLLKSVSCNKEQPITLYYLVHLYNQKRYFKRNVAVRHPHWYTWIYFDIFTVSNRVNSVFCLGLELLSHWLLGWNWSIRQPEGQNRVLAAGVAAQCAPSRGAVGVLQQARGR